MLLKSSAEARNARLANQELSKAVDDIFEHFDVNHDGQLSFAEFKKAVFSQSLIINPFWMNTTFRFGGGNVQYVNETVCTKCRRVFIPSGISDKLCGFCKKTGGSPFATGKYV